VEESTDHAFPDAQAVLKAVRDWDQRTEALEKKLEKQAEAGGNPIEAHDQTLEPPIPRFVIFKDEFQ
jgi:hypothetical protein